MYPRANQFPESISLTTQISVYPNLSMVHLKRIPLEKRPKNVQYRHLLKAPDLDYGTKHFEVFGHVSGQDVVGS